MTKNMLFVPKETIWEVMPLIEKYVRPAYNTGAGEQRWETIMGRMFLGEVYLWILFENGEPRGAVTTEVIEFDGYRCLHVITTGTDTGAHFEDWHDTLYQHALDLNVKNIQFWGRKGWSRAVNRLEGRNNEKYNEVYRVFSMEIDYDQKHSEPMDAPPEFVGDRPEEGRE